MSVLTELLIPFTVIISILFLIQYKWNRRHMVKLASLLPGPPTVPLIGNLLYFFNCTHEDFIYKITDLLKQYGPGGPMRFWLGNNLVIAISDPKDLEVILSHPKIIDKHQLFQYFQSRSLGAFTLSGENWRRHRRFANKMFHRNLMEWYLTIFNEQGHELEKYLEKKLPTETFDISHPIMRCTLDTICRTAIGVNMNLQKNSDLSFPDDLTVSSEIIIERIYKPWLHTDFIFKLTSLGREMFKCISRIHKFTEQVISKRRQILENKNSQSGIDLTVNNPPEKLYIDHMFDFANTENLNDHDIALAALDIFIGGADTSAIGDSYVLAFLGMHKEWQDKIHKEQDEIFQGSSRDMTTHDLDNMVVLEMVIKEILRLYTAPHTVRDLKEDVKTENYTLPAGATIYVLTYLVHRDPRFWSHPDEFYPNHFLPENVAKRPKYSYLPFSSGPRQCPGSKYGMISMKVVLAYILRKFRIECDLKFEKMKYKPSLMLEHVGGYPIRLIPRTKFYHN